MATQSFRGIPITATSAHADNSDGDKGWMESIPPIEPDASLADVVRWTADIGMWALDRPIELSCVHATDHCRQSCFNNKLLAAFGHAINPKDAKNEEAWQGITEQSAQDLATTLGRKRRQSTRGRFMTRGEALSTLDDVERVERILEATPATVWWLPTRSWRDKGLFAVVLERLGKYSNVRILASMDPSNSQEDWDHVKSMGISTMYFDGNTRPGIAPTGERWFKCPKTHKHLKGHCSTCKAGCFTTRRRVDVHLLQH